MSAFLARDWGASNLRAGGLHDGGRASARKALLHVCTGVDSAAARGLKNAARFPEGR